MEERAKYRRLELLPELDVRSVVLGLKSYRTSCRRVLRMFNRTSIVHLFISNNSIIPENRVKKTWVIIETCD